MATFGLFWEFFFFYEDWWKPDYIFKFGRTGIEDFLYGFL